METNSDFIASIIKTLMRTYPENHPRARARRFFPLFAKVGYSAMLTLVLAGSWLLGTWNFPFQHVACMVYGMMVLPLFGVGSWLISNQFYLMTAMVLSIKDRIYPAPELDSL